MKLPGSLRRLFGQPLPKRPSGGAFPNIAVPLATMTMDGKEITTSSTATIINAKKGLLVTGRHCVMPGQKLILKLDKWHEAFLIKAHPRHDIALIRTNASLEPTIPIVPWTIKLSLDEDVLVKGWRRVKEDSVEDFYQKCFWGKICGEPEEDGWPIWSELTKKEPIEGMSGSPVINVRQELIGIFVARAYNYLSILPKKVDRPKIHATPITFAQDLF